MNKLYFSPFRFFAAVVKDAPSVWRVFQIFIIFDAVDAIDVISVVVATATVLLNRNGVLVSAYLFNM